MVLAGTHAGSGLFHIVLTHGCLPEVSYQRMNAAQNELAMPLTGIRVLDLTRLLPGGYCTLLLADMGADVIKVEEPETGDYMRWTPPLVDGQSALFHAINRNKRSATLNLGTDAGRELLLRLVEGADVLVEGNRPGVMERLGIGWDVLHARNPRVVMCSITGYGQDGPFASRAGHDLNYMATAGGLGLNGELEGPPIPLAVQVADIGGGGLQPAVAILGALMGVQRGGEGRWIDASQTRREWQEKLAPLDACCEPVLEIDEVRHHPQIAARRLFLGQASGLEIRPAVVMADGWRRREPPRLGEHNEEVYAAVGLDPKRIEELRQEGVI